MAAMYDKPVRLLMKDMVADIKENMEREIAENQAKNLRIDVTQVSRTHFLLNIFFRSSREKKILVGLPWGHWSGWSVFSS
jgi:Iap family predicted aminopeptidase